MKKTRNILEKLFLGHFGIMPISITPLPQGGSDRRYYRLTAENHSAIGAHNPDVQENRTFLYLTEHFGKLGFPVPEVFSISEDETVYLLSDLGNQSLFDFFPCTDWKRASSENVKVLLKDSLSLLARLQVEGAKGLEFKRCYPKSEFDSQSVMWDFNYFKYSFLKPSGIRFNETKLDDDFLAFSEVLISQSAEYFHYRDFQSRNIMVKDDKPHLIDYQGGRRGPLLYDVASFLYQARAKFPQELRDELLEHYLNEVARYTQIDKTESRQVFPAFALFRVIQTLGAYGYRGFFERRSHFLLSIPMASANLMNLLEGVREMNLKLPTLKPILESIYEKYAGSNEQTSRYDGLIIAINSFSFKKGYPEEHPEHGGGFVFDCRALPNPGRLNKYKMLTGLDQPVIAYLKEHEEVEQFFQQTLDLISKSVEAYRKRGFDHLSVSFGCTGGQHRSVYMANQLASALKGEEGVKVVLNHREINTKNE